MPIDTSPSNVATNALKAIPYGDIIGAPLKACIEAQAMAAQTTVKFLQEVGLNTNEETGNKEAVVVSFTFEKEGAKTEMNVPLLTIVPIPYIAINSIDISFKANISASSTSSSEDKSSSSTDIKSTTKAAYKGWFGFSASTEFNANYSSKKDSRATQDSKYSVEYTMDINVRAGQESMPAGLAKVLEVLNSSISVKSLEAAKEKELVE
jgi:hypothetical protein